MGSDRRGTCMHSQQVLEKWIIPGGIGSEFDRQPHQRQPPMEHVVLPEEYWCAWVMSLGPMPPAVARWSGGQHELRPGDCDRCPHYKPAADLSALTKKDV